MSWGLLCWKFIHYRWSERLLYLSNCGLWPIFIFWGRLQGQVKRSIFTFINYQLSIGNDNLIGCLGLSPSCCNDCHCRTNEVSQYRDHWRWLTCLSNCSPVFICCFLCTMGPHFPIRYTEIDADFSLMMVDGWSGFIETLIYHRRTVLDERNYWEFHISKAAMFGI